MPPDDTRQILEAVNRVEGKVDELRADLAHATSRVAVLEAGKLEERLRAMETKLAQRDGQLMALAAVISILVSVALKVLRVG